MYQEMPGIFTQSKVLFAMGVMHRSKDEMEQMMYDIASHTKHNSEYYLDIAENLPGPFYFLAFSIMSCSMTYMFRNAYSLKSQSTT